MAMQAPTNAAVLQTIREEVDRRHRAALSAVSLLEEYLAGDPDQRPPTWLLDFLSRFNDLVSLREKVISAISPDGATIAELEARTGLTPRQIRGVLYADGVREKTVITTQTADGLRFHRADTRNHFRPTEPR